MYFINHLPEDWNQGKWYDGRSFDQDVNFEVSVEGPDNYSITLMVGIEDKQASSALMLFNDESHPIYIRDEDYEGLNTGLFLSREMLRIRELAELVNRGLFELKEYN